VSEQVTQLTNEQLIDAWKKAPPQVRAFVQYVLGEADMQLRRMGAEQEFAGMITAARMAQQFSMMAAAVPGAGEIAAGTMAAVSNVLGDSPSVALADYIDVASELLARLAETPEAQSEPTEEAP
jgi:hypothetical protein